MDFAVIGLDLSLNGTGMGWTFSDRSDIQTCRISPPSLTDRVGKLIFIREALLTRVKLCRSVGAGQIHVFIEGYAYAVHSSSSHILAELGGVVKVALRDIGNGDASNPSIRTVSPGTLKKWVTGRGNAKKDEVLLHAYKKYGITFSNSDEADAHGLTDMGWHYLLDADSSSLSQIQKSCLKAIGKTNGEVWPLVKVGETQRIDKSQKN
jgi:hypothetical protein